MRFVTGHMGQTAEHLARRFGLSRLAQEEFAVETQQRHAAATARGDWAAEIEPLEVGGGLFAADEHPRPDVTLAGLARLKPAFEAAGTVTAGTASGVCDGAAALVVASAAAVERLGVQPVARLRGWAAVTITVLR